MVGSGVLDQGIPVMAKTLQKLSESVDITVYSFIPIARSKVPGMIRIRYAPSFLPGFLKFYWLYLLFCLDHVRRKYDCIHAQSPFPAGKLALKINALFHVHWTTSVHAGEIAELPDQHFGDWRKVHLKNITRQVCEKSDQLVFMSNWQARDLGRNLGMQRKICILPRGVGVSKLPEKKLSSPVQLLYVGFYHPIKNQEMLLEVLKILSKKLPCELKIVGANYGDEFKAMISNLNLDNIVTIVGVRPYDEMKKYYEHADFLLHTSWFEGLPMVAIEAMAHGAVVCGTQVGIMADLSGDCCVTVPTGDAEGMAKAVQGLVENPVRYEALRLCGHAWAKDHDLNWHVGELIKLYFPGKG